VDTLLAMFRSSKFPVPQSAAVLALVALLTLPLSSSLARDPITGSQGLTFNGSSGSLPYRLFSPAAVAPDAIAPVILFLHGAGERGTNNTSQVSSHVQGLIDATASGAFSAFLLAPQCPTNDQWTNVPFGQGSYTNPTLNSPAISNSLRLALELVDQFIASNSNVDPSRIYITGLSMGGYGTFDAIARRPGLFAAAIPMSGGGNVSFANSYKNTPLWAFHGAVDTVVPASGSRNTIAAIENAGGTRERYTELAGQNHVIWGPIYNNGTYQYDTNYTGTYGADGNGSIYPWLFAQQVPEPSALLLLLVGAAVRGARRPRRGSASAEAARDA
jgi:predicted peptidase